MDYSDLGQTSSQVFSLDQRSQESPATQSPPENPKEEPQSNIYSAIISKISEIVDYKLTKHHVLTNVNAAVMAHSEAFLMVNDKLNELEQKIAELKAENDTLKSENLTLSRNLKSFEEGVANLELKNAKLEEITTDIAKSSLDYEYERSNVVLYDIKQSEISDKKTTEEYAIKFINKYLPDYPKSDLKIKKIRSGRENTNAILISMACSADAFKLTNRCRNKGFFKISQGLTKPERQISKEVSKKVQQLNQNPNKSMDVIYSKRHIHTIVKCRKDNPKIPIDTFTTSFTLSNTDNGTSFKLQNNLRRRLRQREGSKD